jgi:very-short-patch-repair endonuclease
VRRKQKFPKDLFRNLEKAFPCILAGIRDYAEFIPLEKNLFDLIIIDEASQVSVAQALPALIRGKQVIVLGDDKQFSNVKANNASKVTNQELRKKVKEAFLTERLQGKEKDTKGWLAKVDKNFDIKNSILKFSRFIRNYECQLKKHFRCYPEIISYSDKYFYDNTLQCMKIRGKKIEDVIKIEVIEHDGKFDESKNTNELEARHIVKKLKEFKKIGTQQSIGIITPHREQVTLLFDKINELPERDWLFGKCKLKIMTFDTCQGEERDYIFYSMVATKEKDRLNWIFLKDFSSISDEIDGTIKSQRMNVGFSRAKECMHFVLSKPIEEFQGEIKNAMLHYQNELIGGRKKVIKQLDSKMEYKVEEIFYNTKFYKDNKEKIEFIPQFELGKYLKQLDRYYNHPNYRVDFLLIYNEQKIIIEYDGFKEHFMDRKEVNEFNYKYYMKDCDVYRQKILEGYGYKFLRINRFNIGVDPVKTLDNRLQNLVKKNFKIK